MYATTSYGRGTAETRVGGLPQPIDTERYLQALLRAETERRPASTPAAPPAPQLPDFSRSSVAPVRALGGSGMSTLEEQARDAQLRDVVLRQKARERGPERLWRNPYGGPVLTTDPEGMNAYQRELYVPQSSGHSTSPDEQSRAQANLLSELAFRNRFGTPQRLG